MRRHELIDLVYTAARKHGAVAELLDAIVVVESDYDQWAVRYEPTYRFIDGAGKWAARNGITTDTEMTCQRMSWGLAQIMGGTARGLGYSGPLTRLLDPEINLDYAARLLKQIATRYPKNIDEQVAAYNAGSARRNETGQFVNQGYVDLVRAHWLF